MAGAGAGAGAGGGKGSIGLLRIDLAVSGDCLGLREASREARPTIFLAELSMTREVRTGDVATGPLAAPEGVTPTARKRQSELYKA